MSFSEAVSSQRKNLHHCKTVVTSTLGQVMLEDVVTGCIARIPDAQLAPGYVVDLCPDIQMAEVIPRLYLGSQDPTADEKLLCANGITHILSVGIKPFVVHDEESDEIGRRESKTIILSQSSVFMKYTPLLDIPEAPLSKTLSDCFPFIDEALNTGGRIFIHCNAGVSRSPSVVVAYLLYRSHFKKPWASITSKIKNKGLLTLSDALELVRAVRPCIKPNAGFAKQLAEYEHRLFNGDITENIVA